MHRNVLIASVDAWDTLRLEAVHILLHIFHHVHFPITSPLSLQLTLLFSYKHLYFTAASLLSFFSTEGEERGLGCLQGIFGSSPLPSHSLAT